MAHIRQYGLQFLEGEILAFVGVAAGLRASLRLSTCCTSLRNALASAVLDEQLFGRLYAGLAGVENPSDVFLQPPPRHSFGPRCQQSDLIAPSTPRDGHDTYHTQHQDQRNHGANGGLPTRWSSRPLLPGNPGSSPGVRKRPWSDPHVERAVFGGRAATRSCDNVAAAASPMSGGCLPRPPPAQEMSVLRGTEQCDQGQPQHQWHEPPGTGRSGIDQRGGWRLRLKRDLATEKEPSDTFAFAGQRRGKQDVLMAVVPSTPPVIAVTCTTELSLFCLDGKRLPVVAVADPPPLRAADVDDDAFGEVETGAGGDTRRFSPRRRVFAYDARSKGDDGTAAAAAVLGVVAAEGHQRDIRCLAASPSGEMVATGSLDCTIRVRSVPGCDWVRRLRGHNAGVRCLKFHRTNRLISADSLGMMAVWDIFPVSRKLQMVQGHSDSVQVLTWTGGGKRLATGALDGSVVVWSVSTEVDGDSANSTPLTPIVAYGGLCHPYRLVALGRCLVFTSSTAPTVTVMRSGQSSLPAVTSSETAKSSNRRVFQSHGRGGSGGVDHGDGDGLPPTVSKGAHISVVDVGPPLTMIGGRSGRGRVSTGLARLQHLVPAPCLGAVMLSQTESWTEESGSDSADDSDHIVEEEPDYLGGGRVTYKPPRLCRLVSAASATPFRPSLAGRSEAGVCLESDGGVGGALEAGWVSVSRGQPDKASGHHHRDSSDVDKGDSGPNSSNVPSCSNDSNDVDGSEDLDGGAFCTCATFVGRTLFLGYDTGEIWAHRAFDGHRLYRLSTCGSVAHLVEAEGSLFAYASSGVVSRWSWG